MKNRTTRTENCHRTGAKQAKTDSISGASDHSDQDSNTSKYVEKEDNRKRQDGPGGN